MAVLKAKARAKSAVIKQPGKPNSEQKYPIPDKAHARAALARIDQAVPPLTAAQKARVAAKAHRMLGGKGDGHEMAGGRMMVGKRHPMKR